MRMKSLPELPLVHIPAHLAIAGFQAHAAKAGRVSEDARVEVERYGRELITHHPDLLAKQVYSLVRIECRQERVFQAVELSIRPATTILPVPTRFRARRL